MKTWLLSVVKRCVGANSYKRVITNQQICLTYNTAIVNGNFTTFYYDNTV